MTKHLAIALAVALLGGCDHEYQDYNASAQNHSDQYFEAPTVLKMCLGGIEYWFIGADGHRGGVTPIIDNETMGYVTCNK